MALLLFSNGREVGKFGYGRGFYSKGLNSILGEFRRVQEDKERWREERVKDGVGTQRAFNWAEGREQARSENG